MQRLVAVLTSSSVPAVAGARVLQRLLWQWLVVGLLITGCFPAARGVSEVAGVLPLWLIGAPLASLLVFHRSAAAGLATVGCRQNASASAAACDSSRRPA